MKRLLPALLRRRVKEHLLVPVQMVRSFSALRRVTPIRGNFKSGRGQFIDRYYIEQFLAGHAEDIRGHVLEFSDDTYTGKYGGSRVRVSDILDHCDGNPHATIVADLGCDNDIPSNIFDCIICTQVLMYIYDVKSAIQNLHRILKPGGILLLTVYGIAQQHYTTRGYTDYWHFTTRSMRRLFEEVFPSGNVEIKAYGNVLSAIAFLHGLAVEELRREELDYFDPAYEVSITLRAVKPLHV